MNGFLVLDDLVGFGLCLAGGHELERSLVAEVLESLAGNPADVDGLDVVGAEVLGQDCALRLQFGVEAAEFTEEEKKKRSEFPSALKKVTELPIWKKTKSVITDRRKKDDGSDKQ